MSDMINQQDEKIKMQLNTKMNQLKVQKLLTHRPLQQKQIQKEMKRSQSLCTKKQFNKINQQNSKIPIIYSIPPNPKKKNQKAKLEFKKYTNENKKRNESEIFNDSSIYFNPQSQNDQISQKNLEPNNSYQQSIIISSQNFHQKLLQKQSQSQTSLMKNTSINQFQGNKASLKLNQVLYRKLYLTKSRTDFRYKFKKEITAYPKYVPEDQLDNILFSFNNQTRRIKLNEIKRNFTKANQLMQRHDETIKKINLRELNEEQRRTQFLRQCAMTGVQKIYPKTQEEQKFRIDSIQRLREKGSNENNNAFEFSNDIAYDVSNFVLKQENPHSSQRFIHLLDKYQDKNIRGIDSKAKQKLIKSIPSSQDQGFAHNFGFLKKKITPRTATPLKLNIKEQLKAEKSFKIMSQTLKNKINQEERINRQLKSSVYGLHGKKTQYKTPIEYFQKIQQMVYYDRINQNQEDIEMNEKEKKETDVSLASFTEMQLDTIYKDTKQLKQAIEVIDLVNMEEENKANREKRDITRIQKQVQIQRNNKDMIKLISNKLYIQTDD